MLMSPLNYCFTHSLHLWENIISKTFQTRFIHKLITAFIKSHFVHKVKIPRKLESQLVILSNNQANFL